MAEASKRTAAKKSTSRTRKTESQDNPELLESDEVHTAIISGVTFASKAVQYSVVNGRGIFEGDIDLGAVEDLEQSNDAMRGLAPVERAVVLTGSQFRWPGGVVPYDIDAAMPDQQRVHDAIAHWEQHTVIRFVLRTPANAGSHPNYVHFMHGNGCFSSVGMQGNGKQDISLGTGCDAGRGIHEIGHSVGLWHEQSREDRDHFVVIHWENITAGQEHNFNQHISDGDDVGAYDYGSIMHYERTAFTKNGQETVTPINPANAQIGQRVALSAGDLAAVASMYGAPSTFKKPADDGVVHKQVLDPPHGVKKVLDDGVVGPKRVLDPPPVGIKKIRDDIVNPKTVIDPPAGGIKKIRDDVIVVQPPFGPIGPGPLRPGGLSPFLLGTGHHAAIAGAQGDPTGLAAAARRPGRSVRRGERGPTQRGRVADGADGCDLRARTGAGDLRRGGRVTAGMTG